jgi:hypothetical protein
VIVAVPATMLSHMAGFELRWIRREFRARLAFQPM